ncbi:MAG: HAD-IB family phosphatase [Oscillospiraceae bacterium]|jgi:HAD superfamily phosphoserine phosphatase-like hydrolase
MNAYDFDNTIYKGDSSVDFYFYCLKKQPLLIRFIFRQAYGLILYALGLVNKTRFKEYVFSYLRGVKDVSLAVEAFWETHYRNIASWYHKQKEPDDLVISASPEFLLSTACEKLGVALIASKVEPSTGKFLGENCYGEEKVLRFREKYSEAKLGSFYSDSLSDAPMAGLADRSYVVKGDKITDWGEFIKSRGGKKDVKDIFFSAEFLRFIIVGCINTFNGILFSWILSLFLQPNIAFAAGYCLSLTISYLLNSFITFREKLSIKKYLKFWVGYIPNFIIQNIVVGLVYNLLKWPKLIAYAAAAIIGVPVTFLCMKLLRFGKKVR